MTDQSVISPQREFIVYWLPALVAAGLAALSFMVLGHTPLVRALGLAGAVAGITLTVRRLGGVLAVMGGLALAFSPAFWSQTGGSTSSTLEVIAVLLGIVAVVTVLAVALSKRPVIGVGIGVALFAVLFWLVVGTSQSLRLTTLFTAWVLYLLVDALRTSNPRPDGPPPKPLRLRHTAGLLLLLALGVVNDPLVLLLTPAVALGWSLAQPSVSRGYWLLLVLVAAFGTYTLAETYLNSGWWLYPAAQAEVGGIRVPFMMADGWREGVRWLYLFRLVIEQFTLVGVLLGVLGVARLARWYPPMGVVTMAVYAAYALFGLMYFGKDSAVLLLPLLMTQVIWMTYAAYTLGEWLKKSLHQESGLVRWVAPAAYTLLPALLLLRILGRV
ncbi:MAG: hypothetical protein H6672_17505 [Anaerolineaceae bacterium]|nr:hypothetical protein [Anaerolineaceae bacterium]